MRRVLITAILFSSPWMTLAFPINTNTGSFNATTNATGDYTAFTWNWMGYDDQAINVNLSPIGYSNVYMRLAYPRRGTVFLDVTNCVVAGGSNVTATIPRTTLPPNGTYFAEFLAFENGYTNIPTRIMATGKVNLQRSIFENTTQSSWTNPLAGTVIGPPYHTLSDLSLWPFTTSTNTVSLSQLSATSEADRVYAAGLTNGFLSSETDPIWNIEKSGYQPAGTYLGPSATNGFIKLAEVPADDVTWQTSKLSTNALTDQTVNAGRLQNYTAAEISGATATYYVWGSTNGPFTNIASKLATLQSPSAQGVWTSSVPSVTNGMLLGYASVRHIDRPRLLKASLVTGSLVCERGGNATPRYMHPVLCVYEADGTTMVSCYVGATFAVPQSKTPTPFSVSITNDTIITDYNRDIVIHFVASSGWSTDSLQVYSQDGEVTYFTLGSSASGVFVSQADFAAHTNSLGSAAYSNAAVFATSNQGAKADAAVATNDTTYTQTVSKASTAWQNPASATNWTWTSDGKEITLTGYTGPNDVVIPDMLDGLPVTGFGATFNANAGITSVSGGKNVTVLPSDDTWPPETAAFYACTSLTNVTLESLVYIGSFAFKQCYTLSTISAQKVTHIGDYALSECHGLTSLDFPNVTNIALQSFGTSTNLTSVSLSKVSVVGTAAFTSCSSLTSVTFGCDAPAEDVNVFLNIPAGQVTNYVTNPTATGWGATWNGMPVVRLPLYGDGSNLTGITAAQVGAATTSDLHYVEGGFNGLSVKDPIMTLGVDGSGPYATITASEGGDIQYWFGGDLVSYGSTNTVRLTAGTTNVPALNYICALEAGGLTNYTTYPYFPTAGSSRAIMFEVFLMDTNSIVSGYGSAIRSWTENFANRRGLGRTSWIGERVRRLPAIWESGVQASLLATNSSVTDNYLTTSEGVGWQMHSHTIPAVTNRQAMWIINRTDGFRSITNLQDIVQDSSGSAVLAANGDCMAVNVAAFVESGVTPKKVNLMLILPTDDYAGALPAATKLSECIADSSSYDQTGVPVWMQGMTIRIARIVIRRDSATQRTYWLYDRRGQPLGTAGGGSSSSGEGDPVYLAALNSGLLVTNGHAAPVTLASNLTVSGTFSGGVLDPLHTVFDLGTVIVNGTATITRTHGSYLGITLASNTVFAADMTTFPSNSVATFSLCINPMAYAVTWDGGLTNTLTLVSSNAQNIIFHKGCNWSKFIGRGSAAP
jgi:hypothetical protein